jgi:ribonucleoside-triphosphate reductase
MCCRLRLDLRELRKKSGGFFGSGESTGSVGVVTINLPRIAYLARDEDEFFNRLNKMMDIAARSLKIKRETITKLLTEGLYPYHQTLFRFLRKSLFNHRPYRHERVGLNAKWLRKDLTHKETQTFAKKVLNHMRNRLSDYRNSMGTSITWKPPRRINHLSPGKTRQATISGHYHRFQRRRYTLLYQQFPFAVSYTSDIFDALDVQDELQSLYTSGTVFHAFLGEKMPSWKSAAALVRKIAENYKPPITPCPPHIPSAKITATSRAKSIPVPSAAGTPKATAASQGTIAPSRIGTMARHRNSRIVSCTILIIPYSNPWEKK